MRKDVREFIRRLEAGLMVESTPGHYRVLREIRWRRDAGARAHDRAIDEPVRVPVLTVMVMFVLMLMLVRRNGL
jgi:hypothetical protein